MTEQDLSRFLHMVNQLQQLVQSLEDDEQRRQSLAACTNHNQVVALARRWGFEIARRWGEPESRLHDDNLLQEALPSRGGESERILLEGDRWWLTLINSNEASTPSGEWMSQETFEWVLLLRGSARIRCENPPEEIDLSVGDYWFIPPHRRHRVERTDAELGTLWLTLHWRA
jgi:cupin 2 domain-containing protein